MATKTLKDGTTVSTKSVYETGHIKNVVNFSTFLKVTRSMGTQYQPANTLLRTKILDDKEERINKVLERLARLNREAENATIARSNVYEKLKPFASRLMATLKSSEGVTKPTLADAASYNKKIQGARERKKQVPDAANADATPKRNISTSQQSFDLKLVHFSNLRILLESVPGFNPNEKDLNLDAVRAYENNLKSANGLVITADNDLINARNARNLELYDKETGVVALSKLMKAYLRGILGSAHPDYKKINALKFRQIDARASVIK